MKNAGSRLSLRLLVTTSLLSPLTAGALTIDENFSSLVTKESSTAVWNIALQVLHPSLVASGWNNGSGAQTTEMDVGDGSHGSFDSSTYSRFGTVSNNVITIDATVYPTLKFTRFQLDDPYQLQATGGPLVIYSQSTVIIGGTINCNGSSGSSSGTGGTSRCGGGAGGAAGTSTASGSQGSPASGSVQGGAGGHYIGAAMGAGGGGGGALSNSNGLAGGDSVAPPTNTHGNGGASSSDPSFVSSAGGAGGGGGSGSSTENGGGGGGGGGTVIIHAVGNITVTATGSILAQGGSGGSASTGGGGGGGGGGSIQLFSGGTITLTPAGTPVSAAAGAGGVPTSGNAGSGGQGAPGRTWLVYSSFSGSGSETPGTLLLAAGSAKYSTSTAQTAISKSYDLRSTLAVINSVTSSPSSSDIAIQVSGSTDNFVTDDTGWVSNTQLSSLSLKRYLKFKVTLTNSNATVPTQISHINFDYSPGQRENFSFSGNGGCGTLLPRTKSSIPKSDLKSIALLLFSLLLPLWTLGILRRRYSLENGHFSKRL